MAQTKYSNSSPLDDVSKALLSLRKGVNKPERNSTIIKDTWCVSLSDLLDQPLDGKEYVSKTVESFFKVDALYDGMIISLDSSHYNRMPHTMKKMFMLIEGKLHVSEDVLRNNHASFTHRRNATFVINFGDYVKARFWLVHRDIEYTADNYSKKDK